MARRLWGDRVALVASIGWSVYPLTLWLSKQPNSELPFTALLFIAVALFFNALHKSDEAWLRWLAAGALVGAAMLVRPIAILLPFVLCALILWRARSLSRSFRVAACGFLLAGTALLVVPWELWAYRRSGTFVLLSTGGVASMKDGFTFAVDHRDYRQGVAVPADVADFMRPIFSERMTSVGDVVKAVARESRARPTAAIKLFLIKLARAWYGTDSQRMESPILLIQMVVLAILLAATVIAWREAAALRDAAICVWGILLYFWFMNLASLPLARYTAPAIGLLFVLLPGLAARALRSAPELTRAPG
jgi:4-amino-4-deoxy-L-arabinose transferase-like glycosyltransferase